MPSRREMIRMSDAEVSTFLGGRRTLNLASHGRDGRIHLVAMWYGFLGPTGRFDAATTFAPDNLVIETFRRSQKVQNLLRNPTFSALVEAGESYPELRGVELVGTAQVVEDAEVVREACKAVLSRYERFERAEDLEFAADIAARKRVCVRLDVEHVVSWDHTKLDVAY